MYLCARHIMPLSMFPILASEPLFGFAGISLCHFHTSSLKVYCIDVFTDGLLEKLQSGKGHFVERIHLFTRKNLGSSHC